MITSYCRMCAALVLMGFAAGAGAATVTVVPTSPIDSVVAGDRLSFELYMNFDVDEPTIGGQFDIVWESQFLQFESLTRDTSVGDPDFSNDPAILDGLLDNWQVSSFDPLPTGETFLGDLVFVVLPALDGGLTIVSVTDARDQGSGFQSGWISAIDFRTEIPVTYNTVLIFGERVPVPAPAAVWLMLSGLGALFWRGPTR